MILTNGRYIILFFYICSEKVATERPFLEFSSDERKVDLNIIKKTSSDMLIKPAHFKATEVRANSSNFVDDPDVPPLL